LRKKEFCCVFGARTVTASALFAGPFFALAQLMLLTGISRHASRG